MSTEPTPTFRFEGRAAQADRSGYLMTRWDKAQEISVLAANRAQASEKAFAMLGAAPSVSSTWTVRWDRINEVAS